jgi:minor histocompatibility antigen H13
MHAFAEAARSRRASPRHRPAKFLFAAVREAGDERYPFSVLGLGDVVVPGAFVSLMREVDSDQRAEAAARPASRAARRGSATTAAVTSRSGWDANTYFYTALGGYAVGLATTFVANYVTKAGQPALVYIVPSLLVTALGTAAARGELQSLLTYQSTRAAAAKLEREARKAEWKAAKAKEAARNK